MTYSIIINQLATLILFFNKSILEKYNLPILSLG